MHDLLKSYLNRLTNLTANNRSLLLLRLPSEQYLDIQDFNFVTKGGSFEIIESLIAGKSLTLCAQMDSRDEEVNVVSRKLKKINRADKFIYDERGSKDLYVGWPFLRGKLADGTLIRCPLLFFPVEIQLVNNHWRMQPRNDAGVTLNKSFLLAYSYYNKVKIPDELLERNLEDFDTDSTVFRTALYQLFKDSAIEINFNQDNFQDVLQNFEEFKKADFDDNEKIGELKLYPEAVLGIFPQAGSYLVPDYMHLIGNNHVLDIEQFFENRSPFEKNEKQGPDYYFLNSVEEEKTFTPFKMDAYQENALKAIKKGNSIVVQGPPGTGKSQLICNLISDHIAIGKKVLVVCQKRAALDVVYNRMEEKEMNDFLGLVHDFRNDRKDIYHKIAKQIERIDDYKIRNNGLDAIQLERKFLQVSRRIDQIIEEMEEFKFALFDESECGVAVKELYLTSDVEKPTVNLKQEYTHFRFEDLPAFINKLHYYAQYAERFNKTEYVWRERRSFEHFKISDQQRLMTILEEIPAYQEEISDKLEAVIGERWSFEDAELILQKRQFIIEMLGILKNPKAYEYFRHMMSYPDDETSNLWLSNTERVLVECYRGAGPETTLPADQLGRFQEALQRNLVARRSIFRLLQWKLFSKDKALIKRVLVANGLKGNRDGFNIMVEKIDNRLNLEHNLTKLKQRNWITAVPATYEKIHIQNWFHLQKLSVKAKLIFNSLRNFKEYFNVQKLSFAELQEKIEAIFSITKDIPAKRVEWETYLTPKQVSTLLSYPERGAEMMAVLKKDFDALCEYDKLKNEMTLQEMQVIDKVIDEVKEPSVEAVEELFQNSLRIAWIEHIETKYPILRSVSSLKFQKLEAELQNNVREKLNVSNDMLLLRARERTYENLEYNRLNNMVTYRDLHHQVTKKRRIWPLRKLIAEHYEELFKLIPCWMASPESVSAMFPMREMFDLVIFDEASQCFVERGLPAMYRGRQIVIAGDDKQLKPNDLYHVRYEEEDEDLDTALEVDSLLELGSQYLMSIQLQGHYRSKSLDLIDFSNRHFYGGNLRLLPDYDVINNNEPAIKYIKLDGVWENNVNAIEAEKVVDVLLDILDRTPFKDVGVVTFNAKQQQFILDHLDQRCADTGKIIPANWFVKNIENVQGDEKDIIIFSTGYAPNADGKMMMQFGSLNAANGENRLNVAVTRAREKIMVVSSIMPQQLKVEDTKNEGPKLLKSYLEYAWKVSEGEFKPSPYPEKKHHSEWYLKKKLKEWNVTRGDVFTLEEELPFADLTVKSDDEHLGLIITDDDLYYQSISVKDLHVYTPFVLSKKQWDFKGIYSREYWSNREQVHELIYRFVNHNMAKKDS
ncbi:AAA domain-containing protein [Fulvivirga ligni]|uniref:AAA domain-containing protein n=1 Tax=Fulvivirga ligni TaxID=2904246 RepID=UPI001F3CA213|nr:AAA domain-containing protein [Fulvivirga ligni]UII23128.1 AAA domain-containing protein [Fulvivirga ligni]